MSEHNENLDIAGPAQFREWSDRWNRDLHLVKPDYDGPVQVGGNGRGNHTPLEWLMVHIGSHFFCIWGTLSEPFPNWEWNVAIETSYQEWSTLGTASTLYGALDLVNQFAQKHPPLSTRELLDFELKNGLEISQ